MTWNVIWKTDNRSIVKGGFQSMKDALSYAYDIPAKYGRDVLEIGESGKRKFSGEVLTLAGYKFFFRYDTHRSYTLKRDGTLGFGKTMKLK